MKRIMLLALLALLAAACNPTTPGDVEDLVIVWEDPDRSVVCYRYDDGNYGTEFECVVYP